MALSFDNEDFPDSASHLYDVLVADEDIPQETVDQMLVGAVEQQVNQLFNNREELKQRLAQQGNAIEEAREDEAGDEADDDGIEVDA